LNGLSNNNNNNKAPSVAHNWPSPPILSRRMFTPSPSMSSDAATTSKNESEPRRSARSNLGTAPDHLDPSTHAITYHHEATRYDETINSIENYCTVLGIKHPSTTRGRTTSQGGCIKTYYTNENQNLPKVKRSQLNAYFLTCLNWSHFLNVCHTGITTLHTFAWEAQKNVSYENGHKLLSLNTLTLLC
jgi:hypothetical protein